MDLYAEQILDHYKHPRHGGAITDASVTHEEVNLSCGDRVSVDLKIDGDTLQDLGWMGAGCAISQAGMSLLAEYVIGKRIKDLLRLHTADIVKLLGVSISERRLKCALLGLHTLQNAIRVHLSLPPQSWSETVAPTPSA